MKGTTDFLRKLDAMKSVPDNAYLVSLDIKFLYTNIPNADGVKAIKESFDKRTSKNVVTKVIAAFLAVILTLNNFTFTCKPYLQIKDCAMGMICAQSSASTFADHFEKKYIYPFLQGLPLIYLRFIDDVFFLWTGTKEQLTNCSFNLNKNYNSIKFKYKVSQTSITFLDKEITNL